MPYEPVIGLEVHAELQTKSKMFCACAVVDNTVAPPNSGGVSRLRGDAGDIARRQPDGGGDGHPCGAGAGMHGQPGQRVRVKNYFYPDLPKGYQISQYEQPLAEQRTTCNPDIQRRADHPRPPCAFGGGHGQVDPHGGRIILDFNCAGVPLLEIVSEPDIRSAEEAVAYGEALRHILRYLEVNSGDMEKGVIRFEANVSVRPCRGGGTVPRHADRSQELIRSARWNVPSIFEIERQSKVLDAGGTVEQETLGWNEAKEVTYSQRSKEDADDYRYFPEPDLPPLKVDEAWLTASARNCPSCQAPNSSGSSRSMDCPNTTRRVLVEEKSTADYFEATVLESTVHCHAESGGELDARRTFGLMKARENH